ncbi:hypothetical protein KUTG_05534 [Kutzneria sp. 744]|nr:hypothetical protein KUTG_05534 [Kutzneria sp. 744]
MCPELVTGMSGGHRHDEHVGVTMSTNGALFMLIYNAALVLIFNAGQQSLASADIRVSSRNQRNTSTACL